MDSRMKPDGWAGRGKEIDDFLDRVDRELRPKIEASEVSVVICSKTPADAKLALEVGYSMLLGKPIMLVVEPGAQVPEKLLAAADEIVEHDWKNKPKGLPAAVLAACDRMAERGLIA